MWRSGGTPSSTVGHPRVGGGGDGEASEGAGAGRGGRGPVTVRRVGTFIEADCLDALRSAAADLGVYESLGVEVLRQGDFTSWRLDRDPGRLPAANCVTLRFCTVGSGGHRGQAPTPVSPGRHRRRLPGRDPSGLRRQLPGVRGSAGLAPAPPGTPPDRPLHCRAADVR